MLSLRTALPPLALALTLPVASLAARLGHFVSGPEGFDTRSTYLDTGAEVVVFGAQFTPALAQALVAQIRAETASPIRYAVVLHPNPDKFNGLPVLQAAGARAVGSRATAAAMPGVHAAKRHFFEQVAGMFPPGSYPAEAHLDVVFQGRLELRLSGGPRVILEELAHPGVSSTQTVAYLPGQDALVVGDLVHHRAHAWLEGGLVDGVGRADLGAWVEALRELERFPAATLVHGGRGEVGPLGEVVSAQIAYLEAMEQLVRGYLFELGERRHELTGPEAGTHHAALAQRAAEAFPDHALPSMVQYSVYGLVAALLEEVR